VICAPILLVGGPALQDAVGHLLTLVLAVRDLLLGVLLALAIRFLLESMLSIYKYFRQKCKKNRQINSKYRYFTQNINHNIDFCDNRPALEYSHKYSKFKMKIESFTYTYTNKPKIVLIYFVACNFS
jgi:hypothetical protein